MQDSFDSFDDIEEMVMATNNLSLSPNSASEANRDSLNVSGEEDELPRCIIVTNVDLSVFDNIDIKVGLICLFLKSSYIETIDGVQFYIKMTAMMS